MLILGDAPGPTIVPDFPTFQVGGNIGLTGFQCKCEFFFCAEHRYSDRHECAFDFKAVGKQQLAKAGAE